MECSFCERYCDIPSGMSGYCGMYRNEQGSLTENYPDAYLNIYPVSAESIPMLHFYPNTPFLLVSTIGCNFTCEGCISKFQTTRRESLRDILNAHTPEEILGIAREGGCRGISFCLNEPAVSLPTFLRLAKAAKKEGFLAGCSSNGYMTREALEDLMPYLDYANIGIKGSTDARYRECGVHSADPVFRNIRTLYNAGVFVEVSVMYLKGRESEVTGAARRIREIFPSIPFQVMRFIATHKSLEPFSPTREQGELLCTELRRDLDHVYLFNTPATTFLDSLCPVCGATLVHRVFFGPMAARILSYQPGGTCTCGYRLPYWGDIAPIPEVNPPVLGGYRSILGVGYLVEVLNTLGVTDERDTDQLIRTVIGNGYLQDLMQKQDSVDTFLGMIRDLAILTGREEAGRRIENAVCTVISDVEERVGSTTRPRVLAVFCHPLNPVYAPKFVNTLVTMAGGTSLNREQDFKESEDAEYNPGAFNDLDPEVVLVTGFFLPAPREFLDTCRQLGIGCRATRGERVYMLDNEHTAGVLGWLISLMDVANCLHPERCHYSLSAERTRLDECVNGFHGGLEP